MLIYDSRKNKLFRIRERYSPENTLYIMDRYIDIHSPKFDLKKYNIMKKGLLDFLKLPKSTKIVPYTTK